MSGLNVRLTKMDNLDAQSCPPKRDGDPEAEPIVLIILRGFVGAFLGLIVGGFVVPFILALATSLILNNLGGPFFWVLIALPLGILGSIFGARMLCSANAPNRTGLAEQTTDDQLAL